MDRILELARCRLTVIGAVGGVLGLGVLAVGPLLPSTPEVGLLEPLLATSAEETRVEVLSSGRTFGGILQQTTLSSTDQQGLLLAFRVPRKFDGNRAETSIFHFKGQAAPALAQLGS